MLKTTFGVNAMGCTDSTLVSRFKKCWDPLVKRLQAFMLFIPSSCRKEHGER